MLPNSVHGEIDQIISAGIDLLLCLGLHLGEIVQSELILGFKLINLSLC